MEETNKFSEIIKWHNTGEPFSKPFNRSSDPQRFVRLKVSYGIILVRINPEDNKPEAVLERGRYSYAFSEFVHGRYSYKNVAIVSSLIEKMSVDERLDILSLSFSQMWYRIWLTTEKRDLYRKKYQKFYSSWIRDDGGEFLKSLITSQQGIATPRWEFPKGRKLSEKESEINCAIREFGEETGIPKQDYQILPGIKKKCSYISMGVRYTNIYYVAIAKRDFSPSVDFKSASQIAEVAEVRWMNLDQIRMCDIPSKRLENTIVPVFKFVKKYVKGFSILPRTLWMSGDDTDQPIEVMKYIEPMTRAAFGTNNTQTVCA